MSKCIVVGVTGGIAAYKVCQVVSNLRKKDYEVHVIMTKNATEFVAPLTFETLSNNRVSIDTFDRNFEYNVQHISLAKKADCFVIAPASANIIAKISHGIADDMLSTTFLAASCPKLICPAMNTGMLTNPITQDNIKTCEAYGMKMLYGDSGLLACGDVGSGRLAEPDEITEAVEMMLKENEVKKKILITTGGTREFLDPIRYITNPSSGKTGRSLAKYAYRLGMDVTLVTANNTQKDLPFIKTIHVTSAKDMFEAVDALKDEMDVIIMSAAVADFTPNQKATNKIKKGSDTLVLELQSTTDILKYCGEHKKEGQIIIGYAMETENLIESAKGKLERKNCDAIVANTISKDNVAFNADYNKVTIVKKDEVIEMDRISKDEIAKVLFEVCVLKGE